MRYHNITKDDMNNGAGLRVVLWVSGCNHHCKGCQNPITWNPDDGVLFDEAAKKELYAELEKDYISGITFSGGDPLFESNRMPIYELCVQIKSKFPEKTIWLYTGYTWETLTQDNFLPLNMLRYIDVLVDGRFEIDKKDINYPWAGSTNQRVIDVKSSLREGEVVLYANH